MLTLCAHIVKDHPRLCGEKHPAARAHVILVGSPPPMRGKVLLLHPIQLAIGITPAYAGKSFILTSRSVYIQDHPRLCGEKAFMIYWSYRRLGSPPPMRGKAKDWINRMGEYGDHPRLCGEKHHNGNAYNKW